jgi:hypothetical protein
VAFSTARDGVRELGPLDPAPDAPADYLASTRLYVEAATVYRAALDVPEGDLRVQLDLLARRLRELGDRVFDRGRTAIGRWVPEPTSPAMALRLPEEVPIWVAEGLSAGPPLDTPPAPPDRYPPLRQERRPSVAATTWVRNVAATDIPAAAALARAINRADREALAQIARRLVAAAERLRRLPDPVGGREENARLRLGLLVHADAARAGQAAALLGASQSGGALHKVALRLTLIGDGLWSPRLPARRSGLSARLLASPAR